MSKQVAQYNGILPVHKPTGITSHDLVDIVRRAIRQRKIGHTGTLDQRASGLMILCLGRSTKAAQFISDFGKSYEAEICLGLSSKTFDAEGIDEDQIPKEIPQLDENKITKLLSEFTGDIEQTVPAYSAVHVDGQRLYKLARKGIEVELPTRQVRVDNIEFISYEKPHLTIKVHCSKGTYIRTIANDIGQNLGCGAYLSKLVRTSIGAITSDDALTIENIENYHADQKLEDYFIAYDKLFSYGAMKINDDFIDCIINGKTLTKNHIENVEGSFNNGDRIMIKDSKGNVLAIGTAEIDSQNLHLEDMNDDKLFSYTRVLN